MCERRNEIKNLKSYVIIYFLISWANVKGNYACATFRLEYENDLCSIAQRMRIWLF